MSKFMSALKFVGEVGNELLERNQKVEEMTRELVKRGNNIDPIEAKKIAALLVDKAEVTWK